MRHSLTTSMRGSNWVQSRPRSVKLRSNDPPGDLGPARRASPAKVEIASASDCAILVEVGKSEVGWGAAGPTEPFVDVGPLPDGTIYRQACDWKALGVGAPTIARPSQAGARFAVEKPVYAADGQSAQADLDFTFNAGPAFRLHPPLRAAQDGGPLAIDRVRGGSDHLTSTSRSAASPEPLRVDLTA